MHAGDPSSPAVHNCRPSRDDEEPNLGRFPNCGESRQWAPSIRITDKESVMRYIPTSAAKVDDLKKQAKKLQRKGGQAR
jgi:hypothetical protein